MGFEPAPSNIPAKDRPRIVSSAHGRVEDANLTVRDNHGRWLRPLHRPNTPCFKACGEQGGNLFAPLGPRTARASTRIGCKDAADPEGGDPLLAFDPCVEDRGHSAMSGGSVASSLRRPRRLQTARTAFLIAASCAWGWTRRTGDSTTVPRWGRSGSARRHSRIRARSERRRATGGGISRPMRDESGLRRSGRRRRRRSAPRLRGGARRPHEGTRRPIELDRP